MGSRSSVSPWGRALFVSALTLNVALGRGCDFITRSRCHRTERKRESERESVRKTVHGLGQKKGAGASALTYGLHTALRSIYGNQRESVIRSYSSACVD